MNNDAHCGVIVQSTKRTDPMSKRTRSKNVLVNTFLAVAIIFAFLLNGGFKPTSRRGFFCNDPSIQYPVKADTISFKLLLVFALFLPIVVIKICDKLLKVQIDNYYTNPERRRKISDMQTSQESVDVRGKIKRRLVVNEEEDAEEGQTLCEVFDNSDEEPVSKARDKPAGKCIPKRDISDLQLFLFGLATTAFYTGIGKMTCGRLRPHFMQRCAPNVSCSLPENRSRYIEDFECTNNLRQRDIAYITTSWPSGHASMIFFSMLYLVLYLETVITTLKRLRPTRRTSSVIDSYPIVFGSIYTLMIGLAIYISMTRISDYHHHPTDVLSGSVLGSLVAILQAKYILRPIYQFLLKPH